MFKYFKKKKQKKDLELKQLKGVLRSFRIIVINGQTSKNGKGIIPARLWNEARTLIALTARLED